MKLVGVYGCSGFGREVLPVLRQQVMQTEAPTKIVFIDDNYRGSDSINGHRVISWNDFCKEPADDRYVSLAIANSTVRQKLAEECALANVKFLSVTASNAMLLDDVQIGEGAVVCPFVTITSNVKIGSHFHANIYSYVAHDCVIGDYVTFAPAVKCNGNIVVEDHAYIGTGAILRQGKPGDPLIIGRGAVVGMGAVVTKSIPPGTTVVGNPARPMEKA
ncbi:MAG: hypothetical protein RLZZ437_1695 [Pseudomonadota bacterium]